VLKCSDSSVFDLCQSDGLTLGSFAECHVAKACDIRWNVRRRLIDQYAESMRHVWLSQSYFTSHGACTSPWL